MMNVPIIVHDQPCYFVPHSGVALAQLSKLDMFAEALAEGYSVSDASRLVYGTATCGNSMLQRLRKRLGAQAV